jgi:hypothetical protein
MEVPSVPSMARVQRLCKVAASMQVSAHRAVVENTH